jgi:hypothetical protein
MKLKTTCEMLLQDYVLLNKIFYFNIFSKIAPNARKVDFDLPCITQNLEREGSMFWLKTCGQ